MRAVDTNVLVRLLMNDEPHQVAAAELFIAQGAWVSTLVIAETIWVLGSVYGRPVTYIISTLETLLHHTTFVLEDPDLVAAALDRLRSRPSLGFSDCLILETARRAGHLPLGTFDRTLGRLPGSHKL